MNKQTIKPIPKGAAAIAKKLASSGQATTFKPAAPREPVKQVVSSEPNPLLAAALGL